jgi:hypothetical protein
LLLLEAHGILLFLSGFLGGDGLLSSFLGGFRLRGARFLLRLVLCNRSRRLRLRLGLCMLRIRGAFKQQSRAQTGATIGSGAAGELATALRGIRHHDHGHHVTAAHCL